MALTTIDTNNKLVKYTKEINREFQRENLFSPYMSEDMNAIIRETHRAATMGSRPSFRPSAAPEGGVRAYTREGVLRYELEEEEEEEEELGEEEEEEVEVVPADLEVGVEETPLEALAAEEDTEEST